MNPARTFLFCLAVGLLIQITPAVVNGAEDQSSPGITLDGITTILGDKRAMFKISSPESPGGKSFMLVEGQRAGEIELLAVDVNGGAAKIKNHGTVEFISICKTPTLQFEKTAMEGGALRHSAANGNAGTISAGKTGGQLQSPGNENGGVSQGTFGGGAANAKNNSSNGNNDMSSSNDNAPTADSNPTNSKNDGTVVASANDDITDPVTANPDAVRDPWWLAGSKKIEALRIQQAGAFLSGIADPLPLTPLTPPGTPAYLIGPNQAFFNHFQR